MPLKVLSYIFIQSFFYDKGIKMLLGEDVERDYLNDDKIGKFMDKLDKYGLSNLSLEIVLSVINKFQIDTKYSHFDSTSFHLHGKYENDDVNEKE